MGGLAKLPMLVTLFIFVAMDAQPIEDTSRNVPGSSSSQFVVAFARNDADGVDSAALRLFISSTEMDPVPVTVESLRGFTFTGIATNNEILTVEIPNTFQVFSSAERDKGLQVTAEDGNIAVYGLNYDDFTSDAFLALPCDRLPLETYEYYGLTYLGTGISQILIVGCEDDSNVQIGSETIVLNRMETYLLESNDELSGTRIVSNRPLSVYPGNQCTGIGPGACDHITEQVPSTVLWGSNFMSASLAGRISGDIYRMLASQDSTTVTVNCSTFTQLMSYNLEVPGAWQEFSTPENSFCSMSSNKPLLVMQFGLGTREAVGDPFMMMITPVEQYSNNYVFDVLPEFMINYITIYVTPDNFFPQDIIVDGDSLENATWTTVYCTDTTICGYITYVNLTAGQHQLYHKDVTARIGVSAYGFNSYNSYGYPGGLQLEPIQLRVRVNDTVIDDPLYTVTLPNRDESMCYEVHGEPDIYLNLISDTCTSVNALYSAMPGSIGVNRMSEIGIYAVTSPFQGSGCIEIKINVTCHATFDGIPVSLEDTDGDIRLRRFHNRWRIAVPNCNRPSAVMWVSCDDDMLRFRIARGSGLTPTSHGLLGQFWNIPIMPVVVGDEQFIQVYSPDHPKYRLIPAFEYNLTWDHSPMTCYYVGNGQGGPSHSFDATESVIEGVVTQYKTSSLFATSFDFSMFDDSACDVATV